MIVIQSGRFQTVSSCTASGTDANWAATGTSATVGPTSNRTITVPSGNSGNLTLAIALTGSGTMKYSVNSGAFTTFSLNDVITVATTNTLRFELTGSMSGSTMIGNVTDATTESTVGSVELDNLS